MRITHGKTRGRYRPIKKIEEYIYERHGVTINSFIVIVKNERIDTLRSIEQARHVRDRFLQENPVVVRKRKYGTGTIIQATKHRYSVRLCHTQICMVSSYEEGEKVLTDILSNPSLIKKRTYATGHHHATIRETITLNLPKPTKSNIDKIKNILKLDNHSLYNRPDQQ